MGFPTNHSRVFPDGHAIRFFRRIKFLTSAATILISDDDPADIERFRLIFGRAKILNPIQSCDSAAEAIQYLQGEGKYENREKYPFPKIVFLDLIMVSKGGMDVLRWIKSRAEPPFRTLAIVVMTGMGNIEEIRQAYQAGAHSFLIKPLRDEDVLNFLKGHAGIHIEPAADGVVLTFESDYFFRRH
jgi:CheY-like chemotaxis protein